MSATPTPGAATVVERYARLKRDFFVKGLGFAIASGIAYGLYSTFVTHAMGQGVWADWNSAGTALTAFTLVYLLGRSLRGSTI